jgi:hypothetical protein
MLKKHLYNFSTNIQSLSLIDYNFYFNMADSEGTNS